MNHTSAARIALGQVFLLCAVLTCAKTLGFIPNQDERIIAGREAICESVAMNSGELIGQDKIERLRSNLTRVADRCPGMLSAGVRRKDGSLVAQVADHQTLWNPLVDGGSNNTQIRAPIWIDRQRWGHVEFRFEPLAYTGKHAWWLNPWMLHTLFVLAACYVAFTLYLGRKLDGLISPDVDSDTVSSTTTGPFDDPARTREAFDLTAALQPTTASTHELSDQSMSSLLQSANSQYSSHGPAHRSEPIKTSLPADDPVFREIDQDFVESLGAKILELHAACERRDLQQIARHAHWIKESGGTVGFDDFTRPAIELEEIARQGNLAQTEAVIAEIVHLYQRVSVSAIDAMRADALA